MESIILFSKKKRLKKIAIYAVVFLFSSNMLRLIFETGSFRIFTAILLFLAAGFSFLVLAAEVMHLYGKDQTGLVVSDRGIFKNDYYGKIIGLVEWTNVDHILLIDKDSIGIKVKDISQYNMGKLGSKNAKLLKEEKIIMILSDSRLEITFEELWNLLDSHFGSFNMQDAA
ncbi:hypothetical protein [Chondrinema litorale]|uniref:hypothetical protein n=1 Tax=Chondrinema litorale TaxID=2994555 RepID=UPI0025435085|nr:hypothetical protein [Chondrinema litorale]UZR98036.1 hypothetical protein OQ292_28855 [Chondrinema litorale]